jgi:predicted MPP superfamily phosphohydrolase
METIGTKLSRLVRSLVELGFTNFHGVLAVAGALGAWTCVVWAGWLVRGVEPPPAVLLALPLLYALTATMMRLERRSLRAPARSGGQRLARAAGRLWVSGSFSAAFAMGALAAIASLWLAGQALLGGLAVEASPAAPAVAGTAGPLLHPLFRWLASAAMVAAGLTIGYGYTIGQRRVIVTHLRLPLRNLPPALHGFRVVHISDIHVGPYLPGAQLAGYVARINALAPDLVCITGDIVDSRVRDLDPALPVLSRIEAVHGVVAILGNHDTNVGADAVAQRIERGTSFHLLRDGRYTVTAPGATLHVIGIEDRGGPVRQCADEADRLRRLVASVPAGEPTILLAHRPNVFEHAVREGVGLMLAGHTHGGQIALRLGRSRTLSVGHLMSRFCRGLFERDGAFLYVTHGLGVVGQPVRLGVHREIVLIELVAETATATAAAA